MKRTVYERFRDAYGDPPDLGDETDRAAFLQLLEEEVRAEVRTEIAEALSRRRHEREQRAAWTNS